MRSETRHYIELLHAMTEQELRARYKNTVFGFLWMVANPLLQMLVIGFVFTFFIRHPVDNYYYYLFTGLMIWNFFSLSLNKTTPSIVFERSLIKKARFDRSVIPVSIVMSNLVHLILAIILLILLPLGVFGQLSFGRIIYLIPALIMLIIFTIGLSLLTSALNVRYRDVSFFVQALLVVWFYATPVIYPMDLIPDQYIWIWRFNPLTSILQIFQSGLFGLPAPDSIMLIANISAITVITVLGYYTFQKESRNFDDWV